MQLSNLEAYIKEAYQQWKACHRYDFGRIPFEDENLIWATQDYHSTRGELTDADYEYLRKEWGLTREEVDYFLEVE